MCTASLQAIPRSAGCSLILDLHDLSYTLNGQRLTGLNATATIFVGADFTADPSPGSLPYAIVPALFFNNAIGKVKLAPAPCSHVNAATGLPNACSLIEQGAGYALTSAIQSIGVKTIPAFHFLVVHGVDSSDPMTLSTTPRIMWIDTVTLGIFGYYRADDQYGNPVNKHDSDIVQTGPEFVYGQNGPVGILPAKRVALLLSPSGFQRVVACPKTRDSVIRSSLHDLKKQQFQDGVRSADWDRLYQQTFAREMLSYYTANLAKGESGYDAANHAIDQIKADTEKAVDAEAEQQLEQWLSSGAGQAEIIVDTPPPCGRGQIEVDREKMPDPFGDVVTYLTLFRIDLGKAKLDIHLNAKGSLPACGDYTVDQTGEYNLGVDGMGHLTTSFALHDPSVNISADPACEGVLALITAFFGGAAWGGLIGFGGVSLAATIADGAIAKTMFDQEQSTIAADTGGGFNIGLPPSMQLKDIQIDPTGLTIIGLVARDYHINTSNPGVSISATLTSHIAAGPVDVGTMHVNKTKWGCPAGDFAYLHGHWNSTFAITAKPVDLVLPVTIESWGIEIGNRLYILPGVRDVRPTFTGAPVSIIAPTTAVAGIVFHPVPPTAGAFENRSQILVGVSGDPSSGWQLQFHAGDGCFDVRISATVKTGDGTLYTGTTTFSVGGESVTFGDDYAQYLAACSSLHGQWLQRELNRIMPRTPAQNVPPGVTVEGNVESAVSQVVRQAIAAGAPGAYAMAQSAVAHYGAKILNVGKKAIRASPAQSA
jgi:hypothetical protein